MRYATIQNNGETEPAVLSGGQVIPISDAGGLISVLELIEHGADAQDRVRRFVSSHSKSYGLDPAGVKFEAPIPRPPKIICIGLNYRDHAAESKLPLPEVPTMFAKFPTSVVGPGHPIVLPKNSSKPDYEAEFAVVIGRRGRHIAEEDWRDYVFGYTILHDVSARDFQMATSQWMIGKTFDTFAPTGPVIVTADEIADPHNLRISLDINGETLQDSNTSNLIFKIPQLLAYLSSVFTLEPGDIIATGTPAGVGFARKPPRWLKPGDQVRIQVEGIGELVNPVVAEQ